MSHRYYLAEIEGRRNRSARSQADELSSARNAEKYRTIIPLVSSTSNLDDPGEPNF